MLQVKELKKVFKSGDVNVIAVNDVSLSIEDGQFVSIVGKSGSGKSTLLSLLGALDKPTSGNIMVGEQDITKLRDRSLIKYRGGKIGFVFQSYNLVPNLTALENVMLPMEFAKVPKKERIERAAHLLNQVGLTDDKQTRKPGRLSGGEQQRVAIARALANKPQLILADEPTGNLDSQTGKMIFNLLHDLARSENTTIITVTHDLSIAGKTDVTFKLKDGKLVKA
ncbi:MAG TPA: ABC transporter ATP-binding protein [Candidatus Saccharimonadales bacterium]|jgi:putative ABC transport system ATP-binding protein|nr:ABC transporter ATP-binding protein [Candidatus Saccharimonadales bacterium]